MTASENAKKFQSLLKRLKSESGDDGAPDGVPAPDESGAVLNQLVYSLLLWEATAAQAAVAMKRLREHVVDLNELRVCFPTEVAAMLGDRYPRALERAERLHAVLNDVYKREHGLTLERLGTLAKREARTYLDTLHGIPDFVVARIVLHALGGHAMPCDERLRDALAAEGVVAEDASPEDVAAWMERQVRAGEGPAAAASLQGFSDLHAPVKRERKPEPARAKAVTEERPKAPRKAPAKAAGAKGGRNKPAKG